MCISILHEPGDDPHGYESAAERWSPVQSVRPSHKPVWLMRRRKASSCAWAAAPCRKKNVVMGWTECGRRKDKLLSTQVYIMLATLL